MEAGGVRSLVHLLLLFLLLPALLLDEAGVVDEGRHVRKKEDGSVLEDPGGGIQSIPPRLVSATDNVSSSSSSRVSHSLARIHSISQKILGRARQRKKELLARRLTTAINSRRQVKTFLSTTERTRELGTKSSLTSTPVEILSSTGPPTVLEADESTETTPFSPTTLDPGIPTTSELLIAFLKPAETIIPRRLGVSCKVVVVEDLSFLSPVLTFLVLCHLQVAHTRTV